MKERRRGRRISLDSGMIVVIFISAMFFVLVFGLLFYVKNDWCDLLFKNFTENISCAPRHFQKKGGTLLGRSKMARRGRRWKGASRAGGGGNSIDVVRDI